MKLQLPSNSTNETNVKLGYEGEVGMKDLLADLFCKPCPETFCNICEEEG